LLRRYEMFAFYVRTNSWGKFIYPSRPPEQFGSPGLAVSPELAPGINFGVYRVEACTGSEEIWEEYARVYQAGGGGAFGFDSSDNMTNDCIKRQF
jgi:hypothetical protein